MTLLDGKAIMANTERDAGDVSPQRRRDRSSRLRKLPPHFLAECFDNTDRERKRSLQAGNICAWEDCEKSRAGTPYGDVPLCTAHVYETWRLARDLAERTGNKKSTRVVTDYRTGATAEVEVPVAKTGWIYYLRVDGHIKVGYASNLKNRLKSYPPTSEFLYAHRGTKATEKSSHSMLYLWLAQGREWFEDRPEVLEYVAAQERRYGPIDDPRVKPKDPYAYLEPKAIRIVRG